MQLISAAKVVQIKIRRGAKVVPPPPFVAGKLKDKQKLREYCYTFAVGFAQIAVRLFYMFKQYIDLLRHLEAIGLLEELIRWGKISHNIKTDMKFITFYEAEKEKGNPTPVKTTLEHFNNLAKDTSDVKDEEDFKHMKRRMYRKI